MFFPDFLQNLYSDMTICWKFYIIRLDKSLLLNYANLKI